MLKKFLFLTYIFSLSFFSHSEIREINILHTNDLHSHLFPHIENWISESREVGGFANLATLVKQEKEANPNTIYIDAGDYFSGPYVSTLTKGKAVINSMNLLGLDSACIGNHEFDHGWDNMLTQMKEATFPILNGNIFFEGTDQLVWDNPFKIIEIGGLDIGIIGLHGKFAFYDTINFKMTEGIEARDEEKYLRQYIKELEPITDLIILSIHQGMPGRQSSIGLTDVERNLYKDILLAQNVPGVDVIVSGHAHQGTSEALVSNGTIIVSTNAYSTELGKLKVKYDTEKDKVISHTNELITVFDDEIEDDPDMLKEITFWQEEVDKIASRPVVSSTKELVRAYGRESNMGNLFADAIASFDERIDIAVVNSGALRQDIDSGVITKGDLISAFPFPNTVVMTKLKGYQVKKIFNHAAGMTNGILQVSEDSKYSFTPGGRVEEIWIKNQLISDNLEYWVAAPNFVTQGGDGYWEFQNSIEYIDSGVLIVDAAENFLKGKKLYEPKYEGRVEVIE
ncbi:MAG: multifunctional 2',3'-cyclic-nucleotide 2'-phosphodiesterase/5'-nucleotidase/3'-nucleotidase [Gammaproteobacteria bacterium]|nr:multifunctional 2',3'-cyclic-nucleotide 2'-phosphodiesterase/5'-nucleotidase/3'-nucleotidase [Gammaproteobacteria bacterium]HJM59808.1 bifunctional UDP-sugar hydrolase/5'-nucleotidase [SAR86 cluster bacterium]